MKAEILANKGEASVFAADTIDALTDDDIVGAFRADRERSLAAIREDVRKLTRHRTQAGAIRGTDLRRLQRTARQLRDRFTQLTGSDLFGARGREEDARRPRGTGTPADWPGAPPRSATRTRLSCRRAAFGGLPRTDLGDAAPPGDRLSGFRVAHSAIHRSSLALYVW